MFRQIWERLRPPKPLVWITPELALGPALSTDRFRRLTKAGVGSVLDVRSETSDDEAALARNGLHFFRIAVDDHEAPSQEQLVAATDWTLAEIAAGRKVYVHCRSGIGRSPCVACAVLMAIGYPLSDAYRTVRHQRPWATLSETQQAALEEFERRLQERRVPHP
jgi:protein-tyrosine phosphatase